MDVNFLGTGGVSGYGGNVDIPSGISGPGWIYICWGWFYGGNTGPPTPPTGWALEAWGTDNYGPGNDSTAAVFSQYFADLSTVAGTSVTWAVPSGGADHRGLAFVWSDIDSSVPIAAMTQAAGNPLPSIPSGSTSRAGTAVQILCMTWDFSIWANRPASVSAGALALPAGISGNDEAGGYYREGLSAGSYATTFSGGTVPRAVVFQFLLQPPAGGSSQPANSQFYAAASG